MVDERDSRLPLDRHAPIEDVVARHLVAEYCLQKTPYAHGGEIVRQAGLQARVARLPGEAVDVGDVVAQLAVRGALCLGGVTQLELHLAQLPGQRGVGKEIVIRTALAGNISIVLVVVEIIVLVTDTQRGLSPTQLAETQGVAVLHEARQVLLADTAIGRGHVAFGVDVVIVRSVWS